VLTRPAGLTDATVAAALREGWDLDASAVDYAPVGFGSFHWRVTGGDGQWFVTADDLAVKRRVRAEPLDVPFRRLSAALLTARLLADAGLEFVVAPRLTRTGAVVYREGERFAMALYPFVDGDAHGWGPYPSRHDRLAVLDLLSAVHRASDAARPHALVDDLLIPHRDRLTAAFADLSAPWNTGPFGEPARALLDRHAQTLTDALARYEALATAVTQTSDRFVLTHGEPHRGNTITCDGRVVLIDWDTALMAPPERDLWALADEDPAVADDYTARTATTVNVDALDCYRLWWDLTEISIYIGQFREPHARDEDTSLAWNGLASYLDPSRW
jgi:Phosphotransferase enzyme family